MSERKYRVGDEVIYQGLIATVDTVSETFAGELTVGLIAKSDPELTCTAKEADCEPYDGEEYDEDFSPIRANNLRIANMVDRLTDKHFRDGNH